jgi:hypothetical protein
VRVAAASTTRIQQLRSQSVVCAHFIKAISPSTSAHISEMKIEQLGLQCYTIRDHCKTEPDFAASMAKARGPIFGIRALRNSFWVPRNIPHTARAIRIHYTTCLKIIREYWDNMGLRIVSAGRGDRL